MGLYKSTVLPADDLQVIFSLGTIQRDFSVTVLSLVGLWRKINHVVIISDIHEVVCIDTDIVRVDNDTALRIDVISSSTLSVNMKHCPGALSLSYLLL